MINHKVISFVYDNRRRKTKRPIVRGDNTYENLSANPLTDAPPKKKSEKKKRQSASRPSCSAESSRASNGVFLFISQPMVFIQINLI